MTGPKIKPVPLAQLFERVDADGKHYFVGRLADARILIVSTGRISRGDAVWQAYLTPGPHAPAGAAEIDDGGASG